MKQDPQVNALSKQFITYRLLYQSILEVLCKSKELAKVESKQIRLIIRDQPGSTKTLVLHTQLLEMLLAF